MELPGARTSRSARWRVRVASSEPIAQSRGSSRGSALRAAGNARFRAGRARLNLDPVQLHPSPGGPVSVLALRLADGAGEDEGIAIRRESRLRDAFPGVDRMDEVAVSGGKQGGVPGALRLASGHDEMGAVG